MFPFMGLLLLLSAVNQAARPLTTPSIRVVVGVATGPRPDESVDHQGPQQCEQDTFFASEFLPRLGEARFAAHTRPTSDDSSDPELGSSGADDDFERKRRRRLLRQQAKDASASSETEATASTSEADWAINASFPTMPSASVHISNVSLLGLLQYLPFGDLLSARQVCRAWCDGSSAFISFSSITKAAFLRMVPCGPSTHAPVPKECQRWRCGICSQLNVGVHEPCRGCHTRFEAGALRVFMGQLHKDNTESYVRWLLRHLAPQATPLHVESHTSRFGQRGRGAAFVHLDSAEECNLVIDQLAKRAFLDAEEHQGEGAWIVSRTDAAKEHLNAVAFTRSSDSDRPQSFPRQPLVVEARHTNASPASSVPRHNNNNNNIRGQFRSATKDAPTLTEAITPPEPSTYHPQSEAAQTQQHQVYTYQHDPYNWHWTNVGREYLYQYPLAM